MEEEIMGEKKYKGRTFVRTYLKKKTSKEEHMEGESLRNKNLIGNNVFEKNLTKKNICEENLCKKNKRGKNPCHPHPYLHPYILVLRQGCVSYRTLQAFKHELSKGQG